MGFGEKIDRWFSGPPHCPHGMKGEKPLECLKCQGVTEPYFKESLDPDKRKKIIEAIDELKALAVPANLNRAVYAWNQGGFELEDPPEFSEISRKTQELRTLIGPVFMTDFSTLLERTRMDEYFLKSPDDVERQEHYQPSFEALAVDLNDMKAELEEEQPDLQAWQEWKRKVDAASPAA